MRPSVSRPRRGAAARAAWLLLAALLPWAAPSPALTVVARPLAEQARLAELILVGTVASVRSRWADRPGGRIVTEVVLKDLQVVKGRVPGPRYTLLVAGGAVDGRAQVYTGLPRLEPGRRYLLFVRGNGRVLFPVVGVTQGLYRVERGPDGRWRVWPGPGEAQVLGPAAALAPPRGEELGRFLERVRRLMGEGP